MTKEYLGPSSDRKIRILCLHGKGTSASIFASQTTSIRARLSDTVEFVFLDGMYECEPYPTVDRYWSGPYYSHYSSGTGFGLTRAVRRVLDFARQNGPFDGIMGFSQGAILAAAIVGRKDLYQSKLDLESPFRFAILMCGGRPFEERSNQRWHTPVDAATALSMLLPAVDNQIIKDQEELDYLDSAFGNNRSRQSGSSNNSTTSVSCTPTSSGTWFLIPTGHDDAHFRIQIPTVHVFGENDPIRYETQLLTQHSRPDQTLVYKHSQGHTIPQTSAATDELVTAIQWSIRKADEIQLDKDDY